ncbi:hypothetical protein HQ535_01145 [bacterium]|nr:hypothetical protein [bacterium]
MGVRHEGTWQESQPFPAPIVGSAAHDPATHQIVVFARTPFGATLFAFGSTATSGAWEAYEPDPG